MAWRAPSEADRYGGATTRRQIRTDRRNATEIVDAGPDEGGGRHRIEIRRGLNTDVVAEDEPGQRDGRGEFVRRWLGRKAHRRVGVGPEVLDDDFPDVTVLAVQASNGEDGVDAFLDRLPDADQQSRGERNVQLPDPSAPIATDERTDTHIIEIGCLNR
ncbi:MAG: hypothetical protein JRF54_09720 [Deltaproteobacteria bacterium]|nr:hypothetical protein [Deltaproteobacteria bacterium]